MAKSGSFQKAFSGGYTLKVEWSESGVDIATNTSDLTVTAKLIAASGYWIDSTATKNISFTINGTKYSSTCTVGLSKGQTKTLFTKTVSNIPHNADGSKSVSISCTLGIAVTLNGSYVSSVTTSGTATLTTIARKSNPTLSASTIEMGKTVTITTNRATDSFTHKLYYGWYGDTWYEIATGVGASYTWTVPLTFANNIPDAVQGWGTIRCETYNGSTLIGTDDVSFTATVPSSMKPTAAIQVLDATDTKDTYGNLVKGLSKLYVKITGTPSYNSPITKYNGTANGANYTTQEFTTGILTAAGTTTVSATVTDKRGRKSSAASASFTVLDYAAPKITDFSVNRCNADGTTNDQGGYIKVKFSATVTALNSKNTAEYAVLYKKSADTALTEVPLTAIKNKYSVTNQQYIFAADDGSSYDVLLTVTDNHNSVTRATSASTGFTLMHWGADGKSMGIGKIAEKENALQVGLDAEFYGSTMKAGNSYAFQTGSYSGAKGYILLAIISLNTLNVNAPIVFKINKRGALCPMNVYIRFASSSATTDPDLVSITYEGDNIGAFLVKSGTSTWKLYVDDTSGWSNPCLQEWFTTDNQMSRISVTFADEQIEGTDPSVLGTYYRATPAKTQSLLDTIYPVGSIYFAYNHTSPASLFGGTWTRLENAFLWASDESGTIGATGGEKTHKLTVAEMPSHKHSITRPKWFGADGDGTISTTFGSSGAIYGYTGGTTASYKTLESYNNTSATQNGIWKTGGDTAHNNMPPYIQVSAWRRTA